MYPFLAESLRIGHYEEYPLPPGLRDPRKDWLAVVLSDLVTYDQTFERELNVEKLQKGAVAYRWNFALTSFRYFFKTKCVVLTRFCHTRKS